MNHRILIAGLGILLILVISSLYYIYPQFFGAGRKLIIFHAGSLEAPFSELEKEFEKMHPGIDVIREASGSRAVAKKITDLNKTADILAVADYKVIVDLLFPKNYSDWYIIFASNEMVLAYTNSSKYANEINSTNWYKILLIDDVSWGHSDPDLDPCGYRALLVIKLAENYYNVSGLYEELYNDPNREVRPKSVDLLALLESGEIDYAFEYRSVAVQHHLNFVDLPDQIDLAHYEYADYYAQANLTLSDGTVVYGEPILYGITIPYNAKNRDLAIEFIKLLFSDTGQNIMNSSGQPFIYPGITNNINNVPEEIRPYVREGS